MSKSDFMSFIKYCTDVHPEVHKIYSSDEFWMYISFADMRPRERIDLFTSWSLAVNIVKDADQILQNRKSFIYR